VITATFNSASTVTDTLNSVRDQDYKHIEHIIVDGVSTDNTLEIIRKFMHVKKCVSEKDKGIYDAMNKGIDLSKGDVIGILNSDDFYNHNKVLSTVAAAFEDETVEAVYGDLQYVHPLNTTKVTRTWKSGVFRKENFYYGWMPPHPTFFLRKSIYEKHGKFNTTLRTAADYELMLRILLKYGAKAKYIPQVLVKMRAGGVSNASVKNRIIANNEDRMAWKINGLKPYIFTLTLKPIRKISQFIIR